MRARDGRLKILDFGLARIDAPSAARRRAAAAARSPGMRDRHAGLHGARADQRPAGRRARRRVRVRRAAVRVRVRRASVRGGDGAGDGGARARERRAAAGVALPDVPSRLADVIARCLQKGAGGAVRIGRRAARRARRRADDDSRRRGAARHLVAHAPDRRSSCSTSRRRCSRGRSRNGSRRR